MFHNIVFLTIGLVMLVKGADWFVDGASKLAKILRVPSFIIGLTIVSFGTSAPELAVSASAAFQGKGDLSFGNVVGSNIANILLALGLSAFILPITFKKIDIKFDAILLMLSSFLILFFVFSISPGYLSLIEGIIFILLFIVFYAVLIYKGIKNAKKEKQEIKKEQKENQEKFNIYKFIKDMIMLALGLLCIIIGGDFVSNNASKIAIEIGMSELIVGLTITAVGTSLPEIITSVVAAIKKEDQIAVANVIGSNITNVLLILGLSISIKPFSISYNAIFDTMFLLFITILLINIIFFKKEISKKTGIFFVILYIIYLTYLVITQIIK